MPEDEEDRSTPELDEVMERNIPVRTGENAPRRILGLTTTNWSGARRTDAYVLEGAGAVEVSPSCRKPLEALSTPCFRGAA